jgi:enoyl-[acyl-carrier protein] reductase II
MLRIGRARLAAAVSEAGGLGVLTAGHLTPEALHREIEMLRRLTLKPFGVNLPLRTPEPTLLIKATLNASVKVLVTSGGNPAKYTELIKKNGAVLIQVVASVRQALNAQSAGADAVVAEGWESGGILSRDPVTTLALVPQVVDSVDVPVIAAGGIADGRGMAAAFALGACGIQMGTRFLASSECDIPENYKQTLIIAGDTDTTVLTNAAGIGVRILKKELLQRVAHTSFPEEGVDGRIKIGNARSAGQSAGLIRGIEPVGAIIQTILSEAEEAARIANRSLG